MTIAEKPVQRSSSWFAKGADEDDAELHPEVEITGLEILRRNSDDHSDSEASFSYESYARDSFALANYCRTMRRLSNDHRPRRRMSNCSSIGESDSYADGFGYGVRARTASAESLEYFPRRNRRSSIGSSVNDSLAERYAMRRRSSIGSFANDSVDYKRFRNRANRRLSTGSSAGGKDLPGYGAYKARRRASIGSNESFEAPAKGMSAYGAYKARRRASVDSMESIEAAVKDLPGYGAYLARRRASVGSSESMEGKGILAYNAYKTRRRSSMDSMESIEARMGTVRTKSSLEGSISNNISIVLPPSSIVRRNSNASCSTEYSSIGMSTTSVSRAT